MYKEYLGEDYHDEVRKILSVKEGLCPDRMIDAEYNIGAMKELIAPAIEKMELQGKKVNSEKQYNTLSLAARYYLAGVLCLPLRSMSKVDKRYKRNWDKKMRKCMERGNQLIQWLNA